MVKGYSKWGRFAMYFLINAFGSFGLAFLFYHFFGKEIRLRGPHLEMDFFNTLCGIFSIIGLGIAIFQLTALQKEEDIRRNTENIVRTTFFKRDNIGRVEEATGLINELSTVINNTDPNEATLSSFIAKIDRISELFRTIDNHQIMNGCETIIDCRICLSLLDELSKNFRNIIDTNNYASYSKNYYAAMVNKLKVEGGNCEVAIKT